MSTDNTFLAVFTGSADGPRMKAWRALSDSERSAREKDGMAAWQAWMAKHHASVVSGGGPLGKTKAVSPRGIADTSNGLSAFVIVRAASHEAAAKMFENHPHFAIFPGEGVEVMPIMPVPGS